MMSLLFKALPYAAIAAGIFWIQHVLAENDILTSNNAALADAVQAKEMEIGRMEADHLREIELMERTNTVLAQNMAQARQEVGRIQGRVEAAVEAHPEWVEKLARRSSREVWENIRGITSGQD